LVSKGTSVGLYARNSDDWLTSELALYAIGAVPVAIYDTLGADSIAYCVTHADVRVLLCEPSKVAVLRRVVPQLSTLRHVAVFGVGAAEAIGGASTLAPDCAIKMHLFDALIDDSVAPPRRRRRRSTTRR
jgi:long-chain acyl-CoA synthetase